ncbi:hypothetical protein RCO48_39595 [Peribacillus frigoritolerans]|nr:hypothetical protein [Peribacillus frigoritolerans]
MGAQIRLPPIAGLSYELDAIAAVIIGGCQFLRRSRNSMGYTDWCNDYRCTSKWPKSAWNVI